MDLSGIAYIYVLAFGLCAGIGIVGITWLVWACRADRRDARRIL